MQDGVAVESDLVDLVHEQLDGGLVIQDRLRFRRILALGSLPQPKEALGFQQ